MYPSLVTQRTVRRRLVTLDRFVLLVCAVLAGCVSPSPPGADSGLSVSAARASPAASGAVRWGGTIVSVANGADGLATLEIVSRPLALDGRPIRDDRSDGRFVALVDEFLDPEIVKVDRDITVTGLVDGVRDGYIDAAPYRFPMVRVSDYRYWRPAPVVRYDDDPCHSAWASHGFGYHQHDSFYCGGPFGPRFGTSSGYRHGPWLDNGFNDWPHPFPGTRHPNHRRQRSLEAGS